MFKLSKGFYKATMTLSMVLLVGIGAGRGHMAIKNFLGVFGFT
jgi:hypothetical protein